MSTNFASFIKNININEIGQWKWGFKTLVIYNGREWKLEKYSFLSILVRRAFGFFKFSHTGNLNAQLKKENVEIGKEKIKIKEFCKQAKEKLQNSSDNLNKSKKAEDALKTENNKKDDLNESTKKEKNASNSAETIDPTKLKMSKELKFIFISHPKEFDRLKKNCMTYFASELPGYIEIDDINKNIRFYEDFYTVKKLPEKNGIYPLISPGGGIYTSFGIDCLYDDLKRTEIKVEELVKSVEITHEEIGVFAEDSFDKNFIAHISKSIIDHFTTDDATNIRIIYKERELFIQYEGKEISVKSYLRLLEHSSEMLNIQPEAVNRFLSKTILCQFNEPSEIVEANTPAKILGGYALQAYVGELYRCMNNLMRRGSINNYDFQFYSYMDSKLQEEILKNPSQVCSNPDIILETIFLALLLKHRLHTFDKLEINQPLLRRDALIVDAKVIEQLKLAFKTNQYVFTSGFFSTTRNLGGVMGSRPINFKFNIKPLFNGSKGFLIGERGGNPGENEVLFDSMAAFEITRFQIITTKVSKLDALIGSKESYEIDLQEVLVPLRKDERNIIL